MLSAGQIAGIWSHYSSCRQSDLVDCTPRKDKYDMTFRHPQDLVNAQNLVRPPYFWEGFKMSWFQLLRLDTDRGNT